MTIWSAGMPAARAASAMLPGAIALGHQQIDDTRPPVCPPARARRFAVAQLQHVAQHGDPVAAVQRGQRLQRGLDRGRAGAVRVVEQQAAAAAGQRIEPARDVRHLRQAGRDGVQSHAERQPDGDRGQRGVDLVPAQQGNVT